MIRRMDAWIDTHCHLDEHAGRAGRRRPLRAAGRGSGQSAGRARHGAPLWRQLCAGHPSALHAAGARTTIWRRLARLLERCLRGDPRLVAVGEIGLDFFVPGLDAARQERFYRAQLQLARRFDLPVILHVRRAVDPILKQLRRIGVRGGIAHAFNGSRQQAQMFIDLGFRLGFGGAMTFEGSSRIRELARTLPLSAIVLETDAPDIPPAWAQSERNLPANLARYAALLAQLRGLSIDEVVDATGHNVSEVLGGWQPG